MNKMRIALLTTIAICAMAAGCTDDVAVSSPIVCPSKCTEGCKADGFTCKRPSFAETHTTYCQNILACMQQLGAAKAYWHYLDADGQQQQFFITNMEDCLSETDKMNHNLGDDETVIRCQNEYMEYMTCVGENTCNPNGSADSICRNKKYAMYECFEKRTSPSPFEDIWGYKAYCAASGYCAAQIKGAVEVSFDPMGIIKDSFASWTSDGCETRFERLILTPYLNKLTACSRELNASLSCMATYKTDCDVERVQEDCTVPRGQFTTCLMNLK